jgi:hypothetical protein
MKYTYVRNKSKKQIKQKVILATIENFICKIKENAHNINN